MYCCCWFQEEEFDEDLLTFQEVVNHMLEMEEEVIDEHAKAVDVSSPHPTHPNNLLMAIMASRHLLILLD